VVGRADNGERLGTRGSIRQRRRSYTAAALHGGAVPLSPRGRKVEQKGKKKGGGGTDIAGPRVIDTGAFKG
jgi:hypothetical protein